RGGDNVSHLWTGSEIAAATSGRLCADFAVTGVSIDSRAVASGDLYVAIRGDRLDGHRFTKDALAKGAGGALVDHIPEGLDDKAPLVVAAETTEALADLGRAARGRTQARIIGVTGSVGKTGTKEAIATLLAGAGETHATAGNLNNHWGLPLSLARMGRYARYGVLEMGMNHAGELDALSRIARPHVAVITTVTNAHLEYFDGPEGIADAKSELFNGAEPDATAVLNRDNPHFERMRANAAKAGIENLLTFGEATNADCRLLSTEPAEIGQRLTGQRLTGQRVEVGFLGETLTYDIGAAGRHYALNSLAVACAVHAAGADLRALLGRFALVTAPKGRGRQSRINLADGPATLIDESYNASPEAMRAGFRVLAEGKAGRRIAVLGDMLELGPEGARLHAGLADDLKNLGIDQVYTCGSLMAHLQDALPKTQRAGHAKDSETLLPLVLAGLRAGDRVMVKGSAGSRMGVIVSALSVGTNTADKEGGAASL
ncbi:MAG: UDP-N-acetylmuramoyl-tripeptide--D-alanyl-D-alanine ligase, partial [Rhodospirillales bacterium]